MLGDQSKQGTAGVSPANCHLELWRSLVWGSLEIWGAWGQALCFIGVQWRMGEQNSELGRGGMMVGGG